MDRGGISRGGSAVTITSHEEDEEDEEDHSLMAETRMTLSCAEKVASKIKEHESFLEQSLAKKADSPLHRFFCQYCSVAGHSDLQKGSRLSSMDLREWLECLVHLDVLQFSAFRVGAEFKVESHYITKKDASEIFATSKKRGSKASHDLSFDEFFTAIRRVEVLLTKTAARQRVVAIKAVEKRRRIKELSSGYVPSSRPATVQALEGGAPEIRQLRALLNTHRTRVGMGFGHTVVAKARTSNIHFFNPFRDPSEDFAKYTM